MACGNRQQRPCRQGEDTEGIKHWHKEEGSIWMRDSRDSSCQAVAHDICRGRWCQETTCKEGGGWLMVNNYTNKSNRTIMQFLLSYITNHLMRSVSISHHPPLLQILLKPNWSFYHLFQDSGEIWQQNKKCLWLEIGNSKKRIGCGSGQNICWKFGNGNNFFLPQRV